MAGSGALPVTSPPAGVQTPDCAFTAVLEGKANALSQAATHCSPPRNPPPRQTPLGETRGSQWLPAPQSTRERSGGRHGTHALPSSQGGRLATGTRAQGPTGVRTTCRPSPLTTQPRRASRRLRLRSCSCYPPAKAARDGIRRDEGAQDVGAACSEEGEGLGLQQLREALPAAAAPVCAPHRLLHPRAGTRGWSPPSRVSWAQAALGIAKLGERLRGGGHHARRDR